MIQRQKKCVNELQQIKAIKTEQWQDNFKPQNVMKYYDKETQNNEKILKIGPAVFLPEVSKKLP